MSDFLPAPDARAITAAPPDPARTLDMLATAIFVVLTITILYLAREILVPIAIAVLLSFVLSPPIKALRAIGLNKTIAVGLVVLSGFLLSVGAGAILAKQISDLAAEAPTYQATVTKKFGGLQSFAATNPLLAKLNATIADVSKMSPGPGTKNEKDVPDTQPAPGKAPPDAGHGPMRVEIVTPTPGVLTILQTVAGSAASPLATAAFVAILIIFILMQREDLRNRFIRLVGFGDLQRTTLAMNDAAKRLSRYFLAQVLLNASFGIVVAIALAIIGVPGAILWGIVATFMRFIPYIGSIGAAIFPIAMAAAAGTGWSMAIETAIVFVVLESIVGQVVEPMVYGHRTGISPIAVVASATFWTWLWGPIGLVLSTPLTVCLVVIGRHVDRLSFLNVILGDAPALTPVEAFYQRMLVGDPSEIADHADTFLTDHTLLDYCDQIAMPALLMAQADVRRGVLEDKRQTRIRDTMRDLVEDLDEQDSDEDDLSPDTPPAAVDQDRDPEDQHSEGNIQAPKLVIEEAWTGENAVLCVAGRTPLDEAAARLLADLLRQRGLGARLEPASILMTDQLSNLTGVKLVIVSFLDADLRLSQARFAVRRLRRRQPDVPVIAAFWTADTDTTRTTGLCSEVRCDTCVSNLTDAIAMCLKRAAKQDEQVVPDSPSVDHVGSKSTTEAPVPV